MEVLSNGFDTRYAGWRVSGVRAIGRLRGLVVLTATAVLSSAAAGATHLPLSGPIVGIFAVLAWLTTRRRLDAGVAAGADALMKIFPVLFVPAGVGIIEYWPIVERSWLAICVAIGVSVPLSIAATAWAARLVEERP